MIGFNRDFIVLCYIFLLVNLGVGLYRLFKLRIMSNKETEPMNFPLVVYQIIQGVFLLGFLYFMTDSPMIFDSIKVFGSMFTVILMFSLVKLCSDLIKKITYMIFKLMKYGSLKG